MTTIDHPRLLADGDATGGAVSMHRSMLAAGAAGAAPHHHTSMAEIIYVIEQHPNSIYEDNSRHPLVHAVGKALRVTNVNQDVFDCWCKDVRDGFSIRNWEGLPVDSISPDIKVDPRSFIDHHRNFIGAGG